MTALERMNHAVIADRTAPLMFALAISFLVCQATLIVLWVDVPSLRESTLAITSADSNATWTVSDPPHPLAATLEQAAIIAMLIIYPIVWLESAYHWLCRPLNRFTIWFHFFSLVFCVCPSLRLCARSVEMDRKIWLPGMGWRRPDKRLRRGLARRFSVPMIGIALLILPVLIVEFFLKEQVARYLWLRVALHVSTGVIWFAFAAEFILMVSIAEKKLTYVRENWIDLAIIVLPLFSFLRSMQAVRGTRVAKLAKLPQIAKIAKAYRLRGTAIKAFRALVLLDVIERFARPDRPRQIERLQLDLQATQREARIIRLTIARLQREQAEADAETDEDTGELAP